MLPPYDTDYLQSHYPDHTVEVASGMICVTLRAFALGEGFTQPQADLLLRLAPGYPDVPPDMWWFSPHVQRVDNRPIVATQQIEIYFNKQWQRWSRHLPSGLWRSGTDGLESYLSLVRCELWLAGAKAAA